MDHQQPFSGDPKWPAKLPDHLRFFADSPIPIAGSLFKQLPIDDNDFSGVAAIAWEDGRTYYLYGAADEVAKVGIAMIRWSKLLVGPDEPPIDDPQERHIYRIPLEGILDEQLMWRRKLIEWLTNLVCFSATNSQEYYRLFLAAEAYDHEIGDLCDLRKYYNCDSYNAQVGLGLIRDRLDKGMAVVDADKCWFLRPQVFRKLPERPGSTLASTSQRISAAMKIATAGERLSLGTSYGGGYGDASKGVHAGIVGPHLPSTVRLMEHNLITVWLLCVHIVHRAHELAGLKPIGLAQEVFERLGKSDFADSILREKHMPNYEPGDLVIAMGHLAEIIEKRESEYGLQSYRIRFLVKGPLAETPEDCVPADWTEVIVRKSWSREYLRNAWQSIAGAEQLVLLLDSQSDDELTNLLKAPLMECEKNGIPLYPLIPPGLTGLEK